MYIYTYACMYVHICTYTYIYIYTWLWQYDMILGSDALKGRVREALVRTLMAEQGTDMDVGMAAPSGDAGLEQKVGEDAQKPKEEPASERAQAEAGSAGEVSARVSDTWQRALDGVLQEIEELVADDELGNDVVMANSLGDDLVKDDGMDSAVAGLEPAAASDPAAAAPGAQLSEAAALRQDGGQGLGREAGAGGGGGRWRESGGAETATRRAGTAVGAPAAQRGDIDGGVGSAHDAGSAHAPGEAHDDGGVSKCRGCGGVSRGGPLLRRHPRCVCVCVCVCVCG